MNVLITGGASGLGEAITRSLASDPKNKVYFTYLNSVSQSNQLEQDFPNVKGLKCDFTNQLDVDTLADKFEELELDGLVHNAYSGSFLGKHFHKTDSSDFAKQFQENVVPVLELTQAAIKVFRKKKFGKIISILTAALVGNPPVGSAAYVANKSYLQKMAMVWASENARFNISSNCISPAFMETNFTSDMDERMVDQIKEAHPLKRLLQTEEVAEAVSYFINASQQVNGTDLVINAATSLK